MKRRNPAAEFKNKHITRQNLNEQKEKGFFTGFIHTPPTTNSKIESRTDLNRSQSSGFHPFFNTDRPDRKKENQPIRQSPSSQKFQDFHKTESASEHVDFVKRLIYENRTIGHNYARLRNEYFREEEHMKDLKESVMELRRRYEKITTNRRPSLQKIPQSQAIQQLASRINPSLMRKNTNALVKIAELKYNRGNSNNSKSPNRQSQSLQVLQEKLEREKKQSDNIVKRNEKLQNMVKDLQEKKKNTFSEYEYLNNMSRLQRENKDLHNIIKSMSQVLSSDRRMSKASLPSTESSIT